MLAGTRCTMRDGDTIRLFPADPFLTTNRSISAPSVHRPRSYFGVIQRTRFFYRCSYQHYIPVLGTFSFVNARFLSLHAGHCPMSVGTFSIIHQYARTHLVRRPKSGQSLFCSVHLRFVELSWCVCVSMYLGCVDKRD